MAEELSPRARAILTAVEREVDARRHGRAAPTTSGGARLDASLLLALELGVAGHERGTVAERLRERGLLAPDALLDAIFGPGTEPRARLRRPGG